MLLRNINLLGFALSIVALPSISYAYENPTQHMSPYQIRQDVLTWSTAGPNDFAQFLEEKFSVLTASHDSFELKLVEVIPGIKDPERPTTLPRTQSAIIVFMVSEIDQNKMVDFEPQSMSFWHPVLGQTHGFVTKLKDANGDFKIELLLN